MSVTSVHTLEVSENASGCVQGFIAYLASNPVCRAQQHRPPLIRSKAQTHSWGEWPHILAAEG